jgi:hypothetical protein
MRSPGPSWLEARGFFPEAGLTSAVPRCLLASFRLSARCCRAPLRADSGKWLPLSGVQSPKNNNANVFFITGDPDTVPGDTMAGHNKWSKVKRIKGAIDAKRGKIFSKLAKEIAVAVRLGGPDPDANVRLRSRTMTTCSTSTPISISPPVSWKTCPATTDSPDTYHGRN